MSTFMSTALPASPSTNRHPLGLPPGSVRALMSLAIAGMVWFLLMMPEEREVHVPLHLHALMALILVFFAAHGDSIKPRGSREPSPLYSPAGTLRILLLGGFVAVVAYQVSQHPGLLQKRLIPPEDDLNHWPFIMLALFGGFMLGWLVGLGPWKNLAAFQDLKAWVSL